MAGRNVIKVAIVGDAKPLGVATKQGEGFLKGFGSRAAGIGKVVGLGIAGAAVGVGVAAFKIGESFDEAYDKIRIGTGATGSKLKGLESDFKSVVKTVPTDF